MSVHTIWRLYNNTDRREDIKGGVNCEVSVEICFALQENFKLFSIMTKV